MNKTSISTIAFLLVTGWVILFSVFTFQPTHLEGCYTGDVAELESDLVEGYYRIAVVSDSGTSIANVNEDLFYKHQVGDHVEVCNIMGDWLPLHEWGQTIEKVEQ